MYTTCIILYVRSKRFKNYEPLISKLNDFVLLFLYVGMCIYNYIERERRRKV
ncbi:hypothetical protein HanIR_Chr02g0060641 [Helianthus annuus]|nr:hypothetical protein HanIR_Chr02g0060641 [Helianthus annuus]